MIRVVCADAQRERKRDAEVVIEISVTSRGSVSEEDKRLARERLSRLDRFVPDPVLAAQVMLRDERNPSLERPARAEAELDVNGRLVCGRVAAPTMPQAIADLDAALTRQLKDFVERRERRQRQASQPEPGQWRHGSWSAPRPSYFQRPPDERELVRRKTFAVRPLQPPQAVTEMLDLDHDFYLFHDASTDIDAVVYRRDDGYVGLIEPPGAQRPEGASMEGIVSETSRFGEPIALEAAIAEMNVLSHRFMFFLDAGTGRGNVIYMRYDGHYGLIEPAD